MSEPLTLYWQPGCTSCLRAREFLRAHRVEYRSVDVQSDSTALARLQALGVRTVPVLARGTRFVLAQDLDELAAFVGIALQRDLLAANELVLRMSQLLTVAAALLTQLAESRLGEALPGRPRRWIDLAYHVPMIAVGFLDAAAGGELRYEHYERTPSPDRATRTAVLDFIEDTARRWQHWRAASVSSAGAHAHATLRTYYGERDFHSVLERSVWHVAQHCRQLQHGAGIDAQHADAPLTAALLVGLPLPENIWDPEPGDD